MFCDLYDTACALGGCVVSVVTRSPSGHWRDSCNDDEFSSRLHAERTAVQDYCFPVRLGNPMWALFFRIWLGAWRDGVVHCGWCQVVLCGTGKFFGEPHSL